jgi:hypothetical protein
VLIDLTDESNLQHHRRGPFADGDDDDAALLKIGRVAAVSRCPPIGLRRGGRDIDELRADVIVD